MYIKKGESVRVANVNLAEERTVEIANIASKS